MDLQQVISAIVPASREAMEASQKKWDGVGKPLGSLGRWRIWWSAWPVCSARRILTLPGRPW